MTPPLYSYLLRHTREPAHLLRLREQTAMFAGPRARNAVSPEAGAFLRFLVASLGATRALEVGVFTGYSSTAIASALPPASKGGFLLALEKDPKPLKLARIVWEEAGVADRVEARVGDAREELARLVAAKAASDEQEETARAAAAAGGGAVAAETDFTPFPLFDFAFIDADKKGYLSYFESCLRLVRKGGVIAIDNVLWYGKVAEAAKEEQGEEEEVEEGEGGEEGSEGSEEEGGRGSASLEERFPSSEERLAPAPRSVRREQQRLKKKRDRRWAASQLAATEAVRELNARLLADERIDLSIVPVGDGIALCRKL
jgi:predicted O-methyltransferase YrrM